MMKNDDNRSYAYVYAYASVCVCVNDPVRMWLLPAVGRSTTRTNGNQEYWIYY